jgi:Domain of unknown function (DUF1707)/Cell wall-active antibiotics response 4TMS YvqF
MDPEVFNANSPLRASDADRDRAASVLNEALAQGRLTAEEHSERLDSVYAARTHADLVPLIVDLPVSSGAAVAAAPVRPAEHADGGNLILGVFGEATRKGAWQVPATGSVLTICGGAHLDFREAVLPQREISLNCTTICGGIEIVVPSDMRVVDSGIAICGGRSVAAGDAESNPEAPVLRLTGVSIFGGLTVKHKKRKIKPG